MDSWAWIILAGAWLGALLAALAGLGLLGWAITGRRRGDDLSPLTQTAPPSAAELAAICWGTDEADRPRRGRCDCCGYELRGLEHGICPECGWSYRTSRIPGRKRRRAAIFGCGLLALAPILWQAPTAARDGLASVAPAGLLAEALPLVPWPDSAIHRELCARADRETLTAREAETILARCARIITDNREEEVRLSAATLARRVSGLSAFAPASLLPASNDPSAEVRAKIVESLAAALTPADAQRPDASADEGAPPIIARLAALAVSDPDELVRRRAVDGLARCPDNARCAAALLAAMQDPSPAVRERALLAAHARWMHERRRGGSGTAVAIDTIPELEVALRDDSERVREAAVYTLGRFASRVDRAVIALAPVLSDPSPGVRLLAAENLCFLGRRAAPAMAELIFCLDDDDPGVRDAAMQALRALSG